MLVFPSPWWTHNPTWGWNLIRNSICWIEFLRLGGKSLLQTQVLGYSLFKCNYSIVFEFEMFSIDAYDDYAGTCMLDVCE